MASQQLIFERHLVASGQENVLVSREGVVADGPFPPDVLFLPKSKQQ